MGLFWLYIKIIIFIFVFITVAYLLDTESKTVLATKGKISFKLFIKEFKHVFSNTFYNIAKAFRNFLKSNFSLLFSIILLIIAVNSSEKLTNIDMINIPAIIAILVAIFHEILNRRKWHVFMTLLFSVSAMVSSYICLYYIPAFLKDSQSNFLGILSNNVLLILVVFLFSFSFFDFSQRIKMYFLNITDIGKRKLSDQEKIEIMNTFFSLLAAIIAIYQFFKNLF